MFRKSAFGLFDLLMATLAVTTLMTTTPLGELIGRGVRYSLGIRSRQTSLLSFFGSPESQASVAALAAPRRRAWSRRGAGVRGRPFGAQGLRAGLGGRPRLAGAADAADRGGEGAAGSRARRAESELSTGGGRLRAVGRAPPTCTRELGSADAALCALVLASSRCGMRPSA
jgi:hypothetical protein